MGDGQLRLKVAVGVGLATWVVVVLLAVGWGFRGARLGCEQFAEDHDLEVVENTWYGKGDYCTTEAPDGTVEASNQASWTSAVLVVLAIPVGALAGAGTFALVIPHPKQDDPLA